MIVFSSILARIPGFILPLVLSRLFDNLNYMAFSMAFVAASASSAFVGEALAATISQQVPKLNKDKKKIIELGRFIFLIGVAAFLFIASLWILLFLFSVSNMKLPVLACTILLIPGFLLPSMSTSMSNASGMAKYTSIVSIITIPSSIVVSLLLGKLFGVVVFCVSYSFFIIVSTTLVFQRSLGVTETERATIFATRLLKDPLATFFSILFAFSLGGPVHGLCLGILAVQPEGPRELSYFVAYYPWNLIFSASASFFSGYFIQKVMTLRANEQFSSIREFILYWFILVIIVGLVLVFSIWLAKEWVFLIYGASIPNNKALLILILLSGLLAACVTVSSQFNIALGNLKMLRQAAFFYAIVYLITTFFFVDMQQMGATGVALSLSVSSLIFLSIQIFSIVVTLRRMGAYVC